MGRYTTHALMMKVLSDGEVHNSCPHALMMKVLSDGEVHNSCPHGLIVLDSFIQFFVSSQQYLSGG